MTYSHASQLAKMGSCHSHACATTHPTHTHSHNTALEECFFCAQSSTPMLKMPSCGHYIHAPCLAAWWLSMPNNVCRCPMCRTVSDVCMMEILPESGIPVGFYREGFVGRLSIAENTVTEFVTINDDTNEGGVSGRDIAQMTTKSVWMMVLPTLVLGGVVAPTARLR